MSKSNKGLRDMVARMERERIVLEGRARASSRGADRAGQLQASQEAARERDRLKEELEAVKHERLMGEAQGVETLRLRNKLLQVWIGHWRVIRLLFDKSVVMSYCCMIERTSSVVRVGLGINLSRQRE